MDRAEGALLVAEKALEEIRRLAGEVEKLQAAPSGAVSLLIDDEGSLVQIGPDGPKKLGTVRGRDGRDAVSIKATAVEDGVLRVSFTDGSITEAGMVAGPAGRDGIDADEFQEELEDGGRVLVRRAIRAGQIVKEYRHQTQAMLYRGVFREGQEYLPGDTVTFGGSLWHCNVPTSEKPLDNAGAKGPWTLAAKRGRDGKDGERGLLGPKGEKGDPGRDGGKW